MPNAELKRMMPLEVKCTPEVPDGAEMRATFVVATMGVEDQDGDILVPGSVGVQRCMLGGWQHTISRGTIPIGKAGLHEDQDKLIADVEFNPNIQAAVETWHSIKFAPELVEVSFGLLPKQWGWGENYVRMIQKMDVFEVSPVLRGAGIGTGVMSVKEAKGLALAEYKAAQEAAKPEPEPELEFIPTPALIKAMAWYARR